ncbi:MAG: hypothetical protein MJY89_08425 [Bacteroidales bacterium]|nr:hypothetical protein [Bacteroidales bacterium]
MAKFFAVVLMGMTLCSCNMVSSFFKDDEVVAKVGKTRLYRSELDKYIPSFSTPEDSASLAMQYINNWAADLLYQSVALEQLSKSEMDVTAELDDYRRSLLKYRYEQKYVNERLDTLITDSQIKSYYEAHPDNFKLERPILKVRFINIMDDSPFKSKLVKKLGDAENIQELDSLARMASLRYFDKSDTWLDAVVLAKEFGTDYTTMMSCLKDELITYKPEGRSDVYIAYVCDIQNGGIAPIEYCRDNIKDLILSTRKHELLNSLERDLLNNALSRKYFEIY